MFTLEYLNKLVCHTVHTNTHKYTTYLTGSYEVRLIIITLKLLTVLAVKLLTD